MEKINKGMVKHFINLLSDDRDIKKSSQKKIYHFYKDNPNAPKLDAYEYAIKKELQRLYPFEYRQDREYQFQLIGEIFEVIYPAIEKTLLMQIWHDKKAFEETVEKLIESKEKTDRVRL